MKKTYLFLTALFIISSGISSAQKTARSSEYINLYGKWFYDYYNTTDDVLAYEKIQDNSVRFGNYIYIEANRELIVGKSAQCGNDQSLFRNYGTWKVDYKTGILNTSVDILKRGTKFKIIKITPTALFLKKI